MIGIDYTCFKITDVYSVERKGGTVGNKSREWGAIAYRKSGSSVFVSDGRRTCAGEGSVIYIPEGVAFSRESTDESLIVIHLNCYGDSKDEIRLLTSFDPPATKAFFAELNEIWNSKTYGFESRCASMLYNFLYEAERACQPVQNSKYAELIRPGVEYMNEFYFDSTVDIKALAKRANMSEEYFRRLFKRVYGRSPYKVILEKRLALACVYLRSDGMSVEEIAHSCGFADSKHFCVSFRKKMNLTPSEYRENYMC